MMVNTQRIPPEFENIRQTRQGTTGHSPTHDDGQQAVDVEDVLDEHILQHLQVRSLARLGHSHHDFLFYSREDVYPAFTTSQFISPYLNFLSQLEAPCKPFSRGTR